MGSSNWLTSNAVNVWYNPETGNYEILPPQQASQPGAVVPVPAPQSASDGRGGTQNNYYSAEAIRQLRRNMGQWSQVYSGKPVESPAQENDQVSEKNPTVNSFKVGADPEFVALAPDGSIQNVNAELAAGGQVGWDHGGRVLELRPTPSRFTSRLLKNLHTLLTSDQLKPFRNSKWRGGGTVPQAGRLETLGGHVHFDLPWGRNFELPLDTLRPAWQGAYPDMWEQVQKSKPVVSALDKLTRCFESLDILPAVESNSRRHSGGGYGSYGDVRECNGHMEYRTPASWLYSPATAYWVLTGYKLAAAQPGSLTALPNGNFNWTELLAWYKRLSSADIDARRACEKLGDQGLHAVQGDPDSDIKETWRELPI